ncbi:uncharacterized protein LOC141695541 [Apium graveolens]|uniref:uncharacterized protein LOC141695541 n=1 Tax=Apium graveolens TaxID=4045 RepID=UPI003D7958B7
MAEVEKDGSVSDGLSIIVPKRRRMDDVKTDRPNRNMNMADDIMTEYPNEDPLDIMTTLSWNYRGMGLPRKVQFLFDVVRQEQPIFVFLCETMSKRSRLEWVKNKLGYEGLITVDPIGKSGGLALMWTEKDQAELLSLSQNHIDVKVCLTDMMEWRLTGFYGEPDRSKRRSTWNLLRNLARDANLPWCLQGDLNNVSSTEDKRGGEPYPEWLINGYNEAVHDAILVDLELLGHPFTWE